MLIPSAFSRLCGQKPSLSRRVNANSQRFGEVDRRVGKLIKKGEC